VWCSVEIHAREHSACKTNALRDSTSSNLHVAYQEGRSCCNFHLCGIIWSTLPGRGDCCGKKQKSVVGMLLQNKREK
jgi:hypothetical protein